jgi:hypothetical protein
MITALLLPLLVSGSAVHAAVPAQGDPPIQLWISNDRRFLPGDRAKVQVRTEYDGYLIVFQVDPEGRLRVIFPMDPDKDNFIRSDKRYEVRGRGGRDAFDVDATGRGVVYAAVSHDPFRFDGFTVSDHWDYRALAPARLQEDPEPELNELVRRMAQGSYDYDVLSYDVISRSEYVSSSSGYYGSHNDYGWCSWSCASPYFGGPSFTIGFFYGGPYRRYYYDPYYYAYAPFYNPFFYDPYYYGSAYYPRYVYPSRYYGYNGSYYHGGYNGYGRPYTPYRFRGATGYNADYRSGTRDLRRSVNTVYAPPGSRIRQPVAGTPSRRMFDDGVDLPNGNAPRRSVGQGTRAQPAVIEGRRARPRDESRPGEQRGIRSTGARDDGRSQEPRRAEPSRDQTRQVERAREAPRQVERPREAPRQVERPREAPRQVERSSPPQRSSGSGGGGESRGGGSGGRRR